MVVLGVVSSWLSCTFCQRRLTPACPISGQRGDCPSAKPSVERPVGNTKPVKFTAETRDLTKLEKIMRKGSELANNQEFRYAELSFDKVVELDPSDWRGHYAKATALRCQDKPFKSFQACTRGLEHVKDSALLEELREVVRHEYKVARIAKAPFEQDDATRREVTKLKSEMILEEALRDPKKTAAKIKIADEAYNASTSSGPTQKAVDKIAANASVEDMAAAEKLVAKIAAENGADFVPDCPAVAPTPAAARLPVQGWDGKEVGEEQRTATKAMMLGVFRDQWEVLGQKKKEAEKAKAKRDAAVSASTTQYASEQKIGLTITGGHRAMDRPDGIALPVDFRKPVGQISADDLGKYSCDNDRMLISLYGYIFDVSDRPDKYGKDGPYWYLVGKDISWGLITGEDTEEQTNKFYDLFKLPEKETMKRLQGVCSWIGFYEVEYGKWVGRLTEWEEENKLPAPPDYLDPQCVVQ